MDAPDEPIEEVVVEARALRPEDGTTQVTVIEVDERLPASADVATAVQRAPGAVVQRLGGLGDWSSVSIRGSTSRQVEVFLDGLPLNPEGAGGANLSELPLGAFEAVHVYRGAAPLHLDTSAVGGAVDLITGDEPGARVSVASGSWATARLTATGTGSTGLGDAFVALDGLSTHGDFPWYDDGGTRTDDGDDRYRIRVNNATEQVALHARWRVGDDALRLTLFDAWLHREEGVPGFVFDPTEGVAYTVDRHLPTAQVDAARGTTKGQLRLWGVVRREVLIDPLDELTTTDASETNTGSAGVRAQGQALLGQAVVQAMASARDDRVDGRSVRQVLRTGVEATFRGETLVASGTLRVVGSEQLRGVPRVGLGIVREHVRFKIGMGRSVRIPDLTELYGNRGALLGNPDLRDERGTGGDVSLGLQSDDAELEVGGFTQQVEDRIVWTRNAQGLAFPVNLGLVSVNGGELGAGWRPGPLDLMVTGTLTRAVDRSGDPTFNGNQLPGVPWVEGFTREGVDLGWVRLSHDLSVTAGTFTDPTNWDLQPPRVLHGATLQWVDRTGVWAVALDVRNLLDRTVQQVARDPLVDDGLLAPEPVVDFVGYPLPGRTVMFSLRGQWGG